jgi:hypothetical protein
MGMSVLDWKDSARFETQSGKAGAPRELLVYLFYPIDKDSRGARAEYFPHLKEVEAYEEQFGKNTKRRTPCSRATTRPTRGILRVDGNLTHGSQPPFDGRRDLPAGTMAI